MSLLAQVALAEHLFKSPDRRRIAKSLVKWGRVLGRFNRTARDRAEEAIRNYTPRERENAIRRMRRNMGYENAAWPIRTTNERLSDYLTYNDFAEPEIDDDQDDDDDDDYDWLF